MLPNGRRLGAHLPLGNGMVRAADRAAEIGASALQVFSDNPASWRRRPTLPSELPAFRERLESLGIGPLSIHAPYLVNLAGPDPELHRRSVDVLVSELRVAQAYGARFLNVHVGSHRGEGPEAGIDRLADGIATVLQLLHGDAPDVELVLENGSGGGFALGWRLEELGAIDDALAAIGVDRSRFGFCLDTAHLWGAGYAIDTAAGVDATVAAFHDLVGLGRLRMVHLNDSRSELGSRADRHEHVGAGRIGGEGLGRMATHPALGSIAYCPRDAGDGRRVRRREHRARPRPRPRSTAGLPATGRLPHPQRQGPQRPGRGRRGGHRMTAQRARRVELLVLLAILALAALTRLPGLEDRGRWDADQGHDMLVLRALAVDGEVPLLGPKTSIGTFHHGAVYYYLLAPAAIVSAADPVAVTFEIALFGIAAVAGAWWLARLVGGPRAAAIAGLLAAVSPAGIDESTFIWNPNLIPAAAALAFAGAIMARRTGRARWWIASGVGAMVTMQCHVLGVVVMLPLAWAWAADLVRRRRAGHDTTGVLRGGIGAALVVAAGFLPLLASELGSGFAETRGILDYVAGGGRGGSDGILEVAALVGLRSITWPIVGLLTDRIVVSLVTAVLVVLLGTIAVLGRRRGDAPGRGDLPGRGEAPVAGVARRPWPRVARRPWTCRRRAGSRRASGCRSSRSPPLRQALRSSSPVSRTTTTTRSWTPSSSHSSGLASPAWPRRRSPGGSPPGC